jgi:hypothetical protein
MCVIARVVAADCSDFVPPYRYVGVAGGVY